MAKKIYKIMYKYPNEPWQEYDRTAVELWKDTQVERCAKEHPGARVEVRK